MSSEDFSKHSSDSEDFGCGCFNPFSCYVVSKPRKKKPNKRGYRKITYGGCMYIGETKDKIIYRVKHGHGKTFFDRDYEEGDYEENKTKQTRKIKKIPLDNAENVYLENIEHLSSDERRFTKQHTKNNKKYVDMTKGKKPPKESENKKDHLKIMYSDHGDRRLSLSHQICDLPNANGRKSYYISDIACEGSFDDIYGDNLVYKIKEKIKGTDAVGFFSHVDKKYSLTVSTTIDKNGNLGLKRSPCSQQGANVNDEYFNTHKDEFFHYYCIINEGGAQNVYKIPHKLCYWREALIDDTNTSDPNKYPNKFMEALDNLKQGKPFTFKTRAQVDVGDKLEEKDDVEIEISGKAKMADVCYRFYFCPPEIKTIQSEKQSISNINSIYNNEDERDATNALDALKNTIKELDDKKDIDDIINNNKDISDEISSNVEEAPDENIGAQQLLNRYNFTTSSNINTESAENNTITNRRNDNDLPNH